MAEHFFGLSDTGRVRDNNEDAFVLKAVSREQVLACVIDGVGGYEGGEVAAEIARSTIEKKAASGMSTEPVAVLREAFNEANAAIFNEKLQGTANTEMACVLTAALIDTEANQFHFAHVGDTRLYLLRDGSLVKVTTDQSFVGFLEDSGRLTEQAAMAHPKRNEVNNVLGFDLNMANDEAFVQTGSSPFLPGDLLVLCSDGLTDLVNAAQMREILTNDDSLEQKTKALIDAANEAGGKDNITVVIVRHHRKPQKQKATKPVLVKRDPSQPATPPLVQAEVQPKVVTVEKKRSSGLTWILGLLCLVLIGACVWLWQRSSTVQPIAATVAADYKANAGEQKLVDSIVVSPRTVQLSPAVFGQSVTVGDTITIRQDSLRINGEGIVLQADSTYAGPAFLVAANNKYLLLENLTLKDFATAIVFHNKRIELKNVRFINSPLPVQHNIFVPVDSAITAVIRDTVYLPRTSTPKPR